MASVTDSFDAQSPVKAGASISFNHDEMRAVRGVEKNGRVDSGALPSK